MNYVGTELGLFRGAVRWKAYWSGVAKPFVRGAILDVGCGLGVNADHLWNDRITAYTFLEPDAALLARVPENVKTVTSIRKEFIHGTTMDLTGGSFDTLLYIDVLEHISESRAELGRAMELLAPGGHLIILVPAFQFLFSPFDTAIGHHRRYDRALLQAELPAGLEQIHMRYMDSAGFLLSLGNKVLLRQGSPTPGQIGFWDRAIVPISQVTDKLVAHSFGRSLLSISRKV
ncbi:MAG: class I SAM-dependent methyltransferase [Flavobacteriales bacterium]|nr:class I SAM-dependent methyltransferase [Flavobacteriales bacterium]